MIIEIPDKFRGTKRKELLEMLPVAYALVRCKHKIGACDFLNISMHQLNKIIDKYKPLHEFSGHYNGFERPQIALDEVVNTYINRYA